MERRHYKIKPITVNDQEIREVIIDPHYEVKHSKVINDALILELVKELDGRIFLPEQVTGEFSYFATLIEYEPKQYRLVWLLEKKQLYIGVVNIFRDSRRK